MAVLITRPAAQAQPLVRALQARGIASYVAPLLDVRPAAHAPIAWPEYDAVVLTSANAVYALPPFLPCIRCLCVGAATAQAAIDCGFQNVEVCGPDVAGLVAALNHSFRAQARLLYLSGAHVSLDLVAALPQYVIDRQIVYETALHLAFSPPVIAKFRSQELRHVLLFSARTAQAFVHCAQQADLDLRAVTLYGLSTRVTAPCQRLVCQDIVVSSQPTQEEIIRLLREKKHV